MPPDVSSLLQEIRYLEMAIKALVGAVGALAGAVVFLFFRLEARQAERLADLRQIVPIVHSISEATKVLTSRRRR